MRRKAVSLFLCHLLLFACGGVEAGKRRQAKEERSEDGGSGVWGALTYMAVGGGGMTLLKERALGCLADSWSRVVSLRLTLGASGGSALMGKIGAFLGYTVHKHLENSREKEKEVEEEE
uniref:Uncharacterized protein n=1 Tax=Panthera tigris altaica TaxID=74533 RepID=A0A8C9JKA4_PANTA